ncbi:MAG: HAMP domain-containing sensor histidine kinase [Desulfosoma sp.]
MTRRLGFLARLLLVGFFLIGGAVSALGYMGLKMIRDFTEARFRERNQFIADNLARNCELGLIIEDRRMLQRLADNLLTEESLVLVEIRNAQGEIVARAEKPNKGPTTASAASVRLRKIGEMGVSSGSTLAEFETAVLGSVHLAFSLAHIQALSRDLALTFVFISLVIVAFALSCFFLFTRSLLTPIHHLADTARDVASGNFSVRAPLSNVPEARTLAYAVNAMLDALEENRRALEEAYLEMIRQKSFAEMGRVAMVVAHEVKNPLGIIKSSLDLMKRQRGLSDDDLLVQYMEDEIQRLNRLIEDFLLFSKPAKPHFSLLDLNRVVEDVVDRYRLQVESPELAIETAISENTARARIDRDLVMRAVANLIQNALDANDGAGIVTVVTEVSGPFWTVHVMDQGPGIPEELGARIFDPFFTTRAKGTGLGLAFVAQVARSHGGSVTFVNLEGKGARFSLSLPLQEAASASTV